MPAPAITPAELGREDFASANGVEDFRRRSERRVRQAQLLSALHDARSEVEEDDADVLEAIADKVLAFTRELRRDFDRLSTARDVQDYRGRTVRSEYRAGVLAVLIADEVLARDLLNPAAARVLAASLALSNLRGA